MRSLSSRERRLMTLLLVAGFIVLNFLGYQALAQRRTAALARQRTLQFDIARLKELQAAKPLADINTEWINNHLPAYTDIDQLETHLFNVVTSKAAAAGVELTKKDPRPTQKDDSVHRSIMDLEATAEMEDLVSFLHSLQGREDFRFISFLELTPTKDEERVRCQAQIQQWWRADSEELMGLVSADVPRLPQVPVTPTAPPADASEVPEKESPEAPAPAVEPPVPPQPPILEQPAATTVQPPAPSPAPGVPSQ